MKIEIEEYDFNRDLQNDLAIDDFIEIEQEALQEDLIEEQVWLGIDFKFKEEDFPAEDWVVKFF